MSDSIVSMRLGQTAEIKGYAQGNPAYQAKLLALGLTCGTRFTVTSIAPLGDPIGIRVRNFDLSLRREEAAVLQIEVLSDAEAVERGESEREHHRKTRHSHHPGHHAGHPHHGDTHPHVAQERLERRRRDGRGIQVALVGNPNSGKTAVFNLLTGANQRVGNWPGVTVEKKEGTLRLPDGAPATLVDLPGIYSLAASSEDERVTFEYVLGGHADVFVNIIDGTNLERNLYLTFLLMELKVPLVVVVTMMDIVEARKIRLDLEEMGRLLGCPVTGVNATSRRDAKRLLEAVVRAVGAPTVSALQPEFPNEVVAELDALEPLCGAEAARTGVPARWVASRLLEEDPFVVKHAAAEQQAAARAASARIRAVLREKPDMLLADARYGMIRGLCREVQRQDAERTFFTAQLDKFLLNRVLGIPFFLLGMYLVFWFTITVGGAFIDFFDVAGGTVFVDGFGWLLEKASTPPWLVALLAKGVGAGLQTMATFIPPISFMFFCLAMLEDSGYMARAAFVMDRFMRWVGLPGKSFVPMLVGFGCSVPAIMATRTLENKRDRFLTIFMTPFMSCGAKMPVYALFGAAFFGRAAGTMVFMIYLSGIALGIITGLLLKHTLFQGEPSHFIMELPPYHLPRLRHILLHTWERLKIFLLRAGKVIVPMIMVLGFLNAIGRDGKIGNEDSEHSMLSVVGKAVAPVFEPMGVKRDNWPASVALFTGLFAKEAVVGTLNSLYSQMGSADAPEAAEGAAAAEGEDGGAFNFWGGIGKAFATIPKNLAGVFTGLKDPLGLGVISDDEEAVAKEIDADASLFGALRESFGNSHNRAFAYLLFILLYVPCMAAMGAVFRELGKGYGTLMALYLTALGWSVATLYYQVSMGHQTLWIAAPIILLCAMFASFWLMGRNRNLQTP